MTEKYLDFSFEKTNSAYMLFYERRLPEHLREKHAHLLASPTIAAAASKSLTNSKQTNNLEDMGKNDDKLEDKLEEKAELENKTDFEDDDAKKVVDKEECDSKTNEKENINTDKKMECENDSERKEEQENDMESPSTSTGSSPSTSSTKSKQQVDNPWRPQLSKELEDWIWQDNRQFLQDRNIFEHTYFK